MLRRGRPHWFILNIARLRPQRRESRKRAILRASGYEQHLCRLESRRHRYRRWPSHDDIQPAISGMTANQIAFIRTIGVSIRDHLTEGNLTFTLDNIKSTGTPLFSRTIADHDGGAADFDGVICNFDCAAIGGGNGGQNNSGMSVVGGAAQWTDLGGGPGAAVTWGNGTQNSGGSFNAKPVDLSNYDTATIRMSATGADPSVFVQFYMQTGGAFTYQGVNFGNLPVDGQFHDVVIPLAGIADLNYVDTNGINLGSHASDLVINVDSVIYSRVPEPTSLGLIGIALASCLGMVRRVRCVS